MPLTSLVVKESSLRDISALREMKLETLHLINCQIDDISVIADMPVKQLYLHDNKNLKDLRPVTSLKLLRELTIPADCRDIEFLRQMNSIQKMDTRDSHKSFDGFWREFDSRATNGN